MWVTEVMRIPTTERCRTCVERHGVSMVTSSSTAVNTLAQGVRYPLWSIIVYRAEWRDASPCRGPQCILNSVVSDV